MCVPQKVFLSCPAPSRHRLLLLTFSRKPECGRVLSSVALPSGYDRSGHLRLGRVSQFCLATSLSSEHSEKSCAERLAGSVDCPVCRSLRVSIHLSQPIRFPRGVHLFSTWVCFWLFFAFVFGVNS